MQSDQLSSTPSQGLPIEFDREKVDALIAWLKTFPCFDHLSLSRSLDPIEWLSTSHVSRTVLCVTEEVLGLQISEVADNADAIWGQIFASLSSPKLLQRIAGRRLARDELRFVLLSCLLATAVGDGCLQRVTYINRIMTLSKEMQYVLMTLIESFPKTPRKPSPGRSKTPTKSPSRSNTTTRSIRTPIILRDQESIETPRSSGSRRNLNRSFNSATRNATPGRSQRSFTTLQSTNSGVNGSHKRSDTKELMSLLAWVHKFPSMCDLKFDMNPAGLNDKNLSLAILRLTEKICGHNSPNQPMFSSIEDIWGCIFHILTKASPTLIRRDVNSDMSLRERQTFLLEELFCLAVSDACLSRHDNAQIILSLSYDHRKCLSNIIKYGRHSISKECLQLLQMKGTPEIDVSDRMRRPVSDANNSPSGYTPVRKKRSPDNLSVNRLFSPEPIHPSIERVIEDLKSNNESLKRDLERSTTREADLAIKLQELEMTVRRNMIKIESNSLRTMEEADAAHRKEIEELRYELHVLQDIQDREHMAQRQLTKLKDEMDLMQNANEKLAETEEKYRKCRERLEKLADVKECLKREEEAHSASVSECLRLEAEIKSLAPLRRQLEEYKVRAVDAEVKLVECQEDLKRLKILSRNLNSTQEDLIGGTRVLQEEAEALRRKVTSDDKVAICPSIDDGISELNPVVMEELLRLRNENEQLREFAEKRSEDNVQRLEERLDDINRLSDRFRDQYLTTKQQLERTCVELEQTRESEEDLKEELAEWVSKFDEMSDQCDNLQSEIETTKIELDSTCTLLKESRDIEENLRGELTLLTKKYEKTAAESKERLHGWNLTKEELERTFEMLVQSQGREKDLHCELEGIEKSLQSEQQKCAGFENELDLTIDALESTKTELNSALDREKVLRGTISNLTEEKENIEQEHNREKQEREIEKVAAENLLRETHDKLEAKARSALEELQENMNLLLEDERESFRTKIEKANADFDDLKKKSASEIDDLKFQMVTTLETKKLDYEARIAQLTYENTCEIEKIKAQAEKDRESLLAKGKSMMKESKYKAEEIIRELEDEVSDTNQLMSEVRKEKADFENKTRAKISSYKHKLQFSNARISEMSEEIEQLSGYIRGMEREKTQLVEENERFRRQLGGRYGVDGKNQNQMEMLQKEFNAILEENRMLKKKISSFGIAHSLPTITEEKDLEVDESKEKAYAGGRVSASTLLAFREEYEEIIQALNDEKRELMMKNSAAITDVQKAEQRSWELEKEIERLKEEITSVNLSLQRVELQMDDSKMEMSGMNENSFHTAKDNFYDGDADQSVSEQIDELGKENASGFLELNSRDVTTLPTTPKSVLSPANHPNVLSNVKKTVSFWEERFKSPPETSKALNKPMGPTLLELTQKNGNAPEGQPECRQS